MELLRNRNFLILFSGQMVSTFGNNVFMLALPWYVYLVTGSKSALAIVGFATSLPGFFGLFSGVFVDRWHKRTTMIWSDAIRSILSLLVCVIAFFHGSFWLIAAVVLCLELVGTFFNPASTALIPLIVEKERVPAALGLNQSGDATVQLAGQFGGGALLTLLQAPVLFLINGVSFIVSVITLFFMQAPEQIERTESPSFRREWADGMRVIGKSKTLLLLIVSALIFNFSVAPFDITLTAWVKGELHATAVWLGAIGGAFFVGVIGGGIVLGWITKHVRLKWIVAVGLVLAGMLMATIGVYANRYIDIVIVLLSGIVIGILNGALGAYMIEMIPKELLGRLVGTVNALAKVAMPVGIAVFGALMVYLPLPAIFWLMGLMGVLGGCCMLIPIKDDLGSIRETDVSAADVI